MLSRRILAISVAFSLIAAALAAAVWVWFRGHEFVKCIADERSISDPHYGHQVMVTESVCNGIASSDKVSIELVDTRGDRIPVLQYGAAYSFAKNETDAAPVIEWRDKNTLLISIGQVAYVDRQLTHVDDIHIDVRIGEIVIK